MRSKSDVLARLDRAGPSVRPWRRVSSLGQACQRTRAENL